MYIVFVSVIASARHVASCAVFDSRAPLFQRIFLYDLKTRREGHLVQKCQLEY